jgi:hypothetical protein
MAYAIRPLTEFLNPRREHAIRLLDALDADERPPWTLVDVRWTSQHEDGVMPDNSSSQIAG